MRFSPLSVKEAQNLDSKSNKVFNYVIFYTSSSKTFSISALFIIPHLSDIEDSGQDGPHLAWLYRPPATPHPILSKVKIFSKYCNTAKPQWERVHQPPSPLVPRWGVWLCLYVWGLRLMTINYILQQNYVIKGNMPRDLSHHKVTNISKLVLNNLTPFEKTRFVTSATKTI